LQLDFQKNFLHHKDHNLRKKSANAKEDGEIEDQKISNSSNPWIPVEKAIPPSQQHVKKICKNNMGTEYTIFITIFDGLDKSKTSPSCLGVTGGDEGEGDK